MKQYKVTQEDFKKTQRNIMSSESPKLTSTRWTITENELKWIQNDHKNPNYKETENIYKKTQIDSKKKLKHHNDTFKDYEQNHYN